MTTTRTGTSTERDDSLMKTVTKRTMSVLALVVAMCGGLTLGFLAVRLMAELVS